jgi:pimeloyl-ACP methyl ester carboxylesterase
MRERSFLDRVPSWLLRARGFERRFVPTPHGRVAAFTSPGGGELPPVVFLHGIGADAAGLASVFLRVRPHVRRVVAVDFPGHGASDAPEPKPTTLFEMLRDALDVVVDEPSFFFGNSLGGFASIRYAAARPARVRGMMLSSPGGARSEAGSHARFLSRFHAAAGRGASSFVRDLYESPPLYTPLVAALVRRRFADPWVQATLDHATPDAMLAPAELAGLACPVLVVWGKRDRTQPPEQLDFFKAHLPPRAVVEEPAEYTHCPQLERPGELAERFVTFVREACGTPYVQDAPAPTVGAQASA